MRTTIEIKAAHRAKLLELAARRGEKGFSSVIAEALDAYFRGNGNGDPARKRALRLRGSLSPKDADYLRRETLALRIQWR
jgi:hypothetical protein